MVASFNRHEEEAGYRYYLTELLRAHSKGGTLTKSLHEVMRPAPEDDRTAEEIAAEVTRSAGLEVRDGPA